MREVAVGFPNDEITAEIMVSRLRAEGLIARVDRGLHGSWQLPSRSQLTVLVDERVEAKAREILGLNPLAEKTPDRGALLWTWFLLGSLGIALVAMLLDLLTRSR